MIKIAKRVFNHNDLEAYNCEPNNQEINWQLKEALGTAQAQNSHLCSPTELGEDMDTGMQHPAQIKTKPKGRFKNMMPALRRLHPINEEYAVYS